MSAEHTPGPWTYMDRGGSGKGIYADVRATMGEKFADLVQVYAWDALGPAKFQIAYERWVQFPKTEWDEMQEANGYLIAAAPDLLAALQGVLRVADRATDEFDAARAAIAKATGSKA